MINGGSELHSRDFYHEEDFALRNASAWHATSSATLFSMQTPGWSRTCLFALLLCATPLSAQQLSNEIRARISGEIQRCITMDGAPSASIAVVQGGQIVYAEAFGNASLKPSVAATGATRYQIASLSKIYAAQAVLLLEAAGKLSLNDKVSRWYPFISGAEQITLRQLLSHTAGYGNFYPTHYPAGPRGRAVEPDAIIAEWGRHPLLSSPGTQFHYSNLGYVIAARIVEKVSGEPFFTYLQRHVLSPDGMTSAIDLDTIPDGSPLLATGYVREALGPMQPAEYEGPGWSFGAGQVVTTATDVARGDIALLRGRLLPPVQAIEEVTPVPLSSGKAAPTALGLFVDTENGLRRYYHTGEGLGFTALNIIYPDQQIAIVVLVNTNAGATTLHIADALGYLLLPPSDNDRFGREIFSQLQRGTLDRKLLGEDLKAEWTAARSQTFAKTLGGLGSPDSFVANRPEPGDGGESRNYEVVAGSRTLKLHLLVLPDGKLEDVTVNTSNQSD